MDIQNILLGGHKGGGDEIHSVCYTEKNVGLILLAEVGAGHDLIGKRHALSVAQHAANQTFAADIVTADFLHLKLHHTVVYGDNISGLQVLVQSFIVHADPGFVSLHLIRGKGKRSAVRNRHFSGCKSTNSVFGAFRIQHNRNRKSQLLPYPLNQLNFLCVLLMGAVGEIQPRNIHAGKAHLRQGFFILAGRTDGANDFCFSHSTPPVF